MDLSTVLVAGVNQSTGSAESSEIVIRKEVNVDAAYFALQAAEAAGGTAAGTLMRAPARTVTRMWRAGNAFRVEIDAVEEDGSLSPSKLFVSDGVEAVRMDWNVPDTIKPGIAEYLSPERAFARQPERTWEHFYRPRRSLPLADATDQGYAVRTESDEPVQLHGHSVYGLVLDREDERITMYLAPKLGFLPLETRVHDAGGTLLSQTEVLEVREFSGKPLPAKWVHRRFQGEETVSRVEISIENAAFDAPIDPGRFAWAIPEGFHVKGRGN